jgi:hypothetical protein
LSADNLAAAAGIAFLAALCQSVTGFGFALTMTPLLAVAWSVKPAIATSVVLGTLINVPLVAEVRGHISFPRVGVLLAGYAVGVVPGVVLLERLDADTLRILVATTVIVASFLLYRSPEIARGGDTIPLRLVAGALGGAIGSSTSLSGPPVVLYLIGRVRDVNSFRATLLAFFFPSSVLTLAAFVAVGEITDDVLLTSAAALPAAGVGLVAGAWLRRRLDPARFRTIVIAVLIITALAVLASAVAG